ncbi:MAG: tetratricopeptide repeat protein [Myxococcales bacterium]|nr:tetratricopeptide repeat protein [Myxococcales bacterium]
MIAIGAHTATAQPTPDDRARALELFRDSDAHYKRGEFEKAAELLREAYALHPEPILLYNLARALEGLGDFPGAIEQYERYLNADAQIADRGAIERRVATLRAQVERTRAPPPDADAPPTPPVSDIRTLPPTAEPSPPRGDAAPAGAHAGPRRLPWVIAGAGGVVVGVGAAFGYLSQARHDDAVAAPIQADAARLQDRAHTFATVANVAFAVGGVAAVAGVAWGLYARRHDRARPTVAGARLDVGPGAVAATWVFE